MLEKSNGLYLLNCIRGLAIFPLDEPDPTKWIDLKLIVQGRRSAEVMIARELADDRSEADYSESILKSISEARTGTKQRIRQ